MKCVSGVYAITCEETGKSYIGRSKNAPLCWCNYICRLLAGSHFCKPLQRDFDKYGLQAFSFRVLEVVEPCGDLHDTKVRLRRSYPEEILYNTVMVYEQKTVRDPERFLSYINTRWLVPRGASEDEIQRRRIWRPEDKAEIVQMAIDCKMFALWPSKVTFLAVVRLLSGVMGYEIEDGRATLDGKQQRYKLIIGLDESANKYVPAKETISE